jgi:hypothetical protein
MHVLWQFPADVVLHGLICFDCLVLHCHYFVAVDTVLAAAAAARATDANLCSLLHSCSHFLANLNRAAYFLFTSLAAAVVSAAAGPGTISGPAPG